MTTDLNIDELRTLRDALTAPLALLIPMASDGSGSDQHGGRIQDAPRKLRAALAQVIAAGRIAERLAGPSRPTPQNR
ncbi:MAG: hypothetical protein J0L84_20160 [Verrucomicrobia bacterium]|nr:hypothetical protein [Verrucomicrobiota bacterium]